MERLAEGAGIQPQEALHLQRRDLGIHLHAEEGGVQLHLLPEEGAVLLLLHLPGGADLHLLKGADLHHLTGIPLLKDGTRHPFKEDTPPLHPQKEELLHHCPSLLQNVEYHNLLLLQSAEYHIHLHKNIKGHLEESGVLHHYPLNTVKELLLAGQGEKPAPHHRLNVLHLLHVHEQLEALRVLQLTGEEGPHLLPGGSSPLHQALGQLDEYQGLQNRRNLKRNLPVHSLQEAHHRDLFLGPRSQLP